MLVNLMVIKEGANGHRKYYQLMGEELEGVRLWKRR
jgi:hypothetical protein